MTITFLIPTGKDISKPVSREAPYLPRTGELVELDDGLYKVKAVHWKADGDAPLAPYVLLEAV